MAIGNGKSIILGMDTSKSSHTAFHALCVRPDIHFEGQKEEEVVILSMRAHPLTLLPVFFNSLVFFLIIFLLNMYLAQILHPIQTIYINLFFIFFVCVYFWIHILNWYFNVGIVTTKKVIDVDFNAILFKEITQTELSNVEDVTVKTSGFISGIFDYGNIFVQTAGTVVNTEFLNVPHPGNAAHIIQEILKTYGAH